MRNPVWLCHAGIFAPDIPTIVWGKCDLPLRFAQNPTPYLRLRTGINPVPTGDLGAGYFPLAVYITRLPALAPVSTSSRNKSAPPVPADKIIPSETPNFILRGARFATTITWRPIRSSGLL